VKSRTVVGHEWILDRLEMGHRSNVTRAMAEFRNGGDREKKRSQSNNDHMLGLTPI